MLTLCRTFFHMLRGTKKNRERDSPQNDWPFVVVKIQFVRQDTNKKCNLNNQFKCKNKKVKRLQKTFD